jgi:ribosomal protein L37AE/L43A
MNRCPCCSEKLLRHARHGTVYWFCTHCWQEMPDLAMGIGGEKNHPLRPRQRELIGSSGFS